MFEADVSDKDVLPQHPPWDREGRAALREAYQQRLESLQSVDEAVGRHVRLLRRLGELANTVVVFTSDNGYLLGEHRMLAKLWHVRESLEVPLVMRGPGIPRGFVARTLVTGVDLPVTFASWARAAPGRVVDGQDLCPLIRAEHVSGSAEERVLPIEAYPVLGGVRRLYAGIRVGDRFTYARHRDGSEDLFDLRADPFELESVDDDPAYAEVLAAARELTRTISDCTGEACLPAVDFPATP